MQSPSYDPIIEKDFQQNIFDPIYSTTMPSSSTRTSILSSFHPHSLAIFFLVVATGSLFGEQPFARTVSEQYYALARAAFSLKSIAHESSVASVQALFMFILFKYYTDRSTSDSRWLLSGLCFRLGHTVRLSGSSSVSVLTVFCTTSSSGSVSASYILAVT